MERRAKEIVQEAGANSEERFNRVVLGEVTFRERAKAYLQEAVTRNRKPIRDTTSIEGAFRKWIFPEIGKTSSLDYSRFFWSEKQRMP